MNLKPLTWPAIAGIVLAGWLALPAQTNGQADADSPAFTSLLGELAVQQTAVADNQTKIDAKIAAIAEDIRLTRIYAGRGGGKSLGK